MSSVPISCTIITKNEADRLARCVGAVAGLVDEIVVIDSGSTDDTVAVATRLGARVVHHDWRGYGPQKRFAEDTAKNEWILNLDADEVVTPSLFQEIQALMASDPPLRAYRMRIRNVYPGWTKPNLLAETCHRVRLYDKRVVRFHESAVHDTVDTRTEPVGRLRGQVAHFSGRSYEHIRRKYEAYTTLQAQVLFKPLWWLLLRLPFEYPAAFVRYYIFRGHFTGAWDGIYNSHMVARIRLNRILKMLAAPRAAKPRPDLGDRR